MLSIKSALGSVFSHSKKVITHSRSDATWLSSQFTVGRTIQPFAVDSCTPACSWNHIKIMSFLKWVYHMTSLSPMSENHSTLMCFAYLLCLQYGKTALDFAESFGRKVHRKLGISLPRSNLAYMCCKQPETGPIFLVKEGHTLSNIGSRVYRTSLADPTMVENSFSLFNPSLI